jgi:8-oxo-dGTP pyrophosphatase MutT (NUDIX family)
MGTEDADLLRRDNPWITKTSRVAYENKWIRVREDEVIRPDGSPGIYGVVEVPASIGVVALDKKDQVVLVGQWRYTLGRYMVEIPRGGSEKNPDLLDVAKRELLEEAGVEADHWEPLGTVDVNSGITTDVQHLFLATQLRVTEVTGHLDAEEQIDVVWTPFERAIEMVMAGEITEVCSVAALLKVARRRS